LTPPRFASLSILTGLTTLGPAFTTPNPVNPPASARLYLLAPGRGGDRIEAIEAEADLLTALVAFEILLDDDEFVEEEDVCA